MTRWTGEPVYLDDEEWAAIEGDRLARVAEERAGERVAGSSENDPARSLVATPVSEVRPERVAWLWRARLPLRGLSILAGEPGLGKSTLAMLLAAETSRGALDGDLVTQPAAALVVSYEDGAGAVLRPRLEAVGADLQRVHVVTARQDGDDDLVGLPDDAQRLAALAQGSGAKLLVIDPLTAALSAGIDAKSDHSVRRALAPLAAAAERSGIAVVVVMHLRKSEADHLLHRVSGSVAFVGAARSVLAFARDPDDADGDHGYRRVIVHAKSNWGRYAPSLACHVEGDTAPGPDGAGMPTSRLVFDGECDLAPSDLLATQSSDERSDRQEAREFLLAELRDGRRPADDMRQAARDAGISERTIKRAKSDLAIQSERDGFGADGRWYWDLSGIGGQPKEGHARHVESAPYEKPPSTRAIPATGEPPEDHRGPVARVGPLWAGEPPACAYRSHRGRDWRAASGRLICGVCHPPAPGVSAEAATP